MDGMVKLVRLGWSGWVGQDGLVGLGWSGWLVGLGCPTLVGLVRFSWVCQVGLVAFGLVGRVDLVGLVKLC